VRNGFRVHSLKNEATMAVHSVHIFDRKGKTLFTKRYYPLTSSEQQDSGNANNEEQLSEQRKLVFGMIYSLREITKMLAPFNNNDNSGLHSVKTGASTLHTYETASGLRFCIYTTNFANSDPTSATDSLASTNMSSASHHNTSTTKSVRAALDFIYNELWIQCVTRSPLYLPTAPNVLETNFEAKLDSYLKAQPWFA
jgi:trafficking protein particle complex subunit 1